MAYLLLFLTVLSAAWFIPEIPASDYISDDLAAFLCEYNVVSNNSDEIQAGLPGHDFIISRNIPIDLPVFYPHSCMYIEEVVNGDPYREYVLVFEQNKTVFTATPYNFTKKSYFQPGRFEPQLLSDLKLEDFQGDSSCHETYELISQTLFVGSFEDCRHTVNGKHPLYSFTIDCEGLQILVPVTSSEHTAATAYTYKRTGPSRPIPRARPDFKCPCDK